MCGVRAAVVNRVRARESVARAVSPSFEPKLKRSEYLRRGSTIVRIIDRSMKEYVPDSYVNF